MNKSFLTESCEDYRSASSLLEGGHYSRALFFFQQSVEKAFKYICLEVGAIELSDTKHLSHNVFKMINKLCDHFQKVTNIPEVNIAEQVEFDLNQLTNFKDENEKVVAVSELIKKLFCAPPYYDKRGDETYTAAFIRIAKKSGLNFPESQIQALEELERYHPNLVRSSLKDVIIFYNTGIKILVLISTYSIYTNHFNSDTLRYPSATINEPSTYFNPSNIFIQALPKMLETYNQYVLIHIEEVNWSMFR